MTWNEPTASSTDETTTAGPLALLAVFAHPDDETFRCGGTLALLARRGVRVHLLTATRGEASSCGDPPLCTPAELPAMREQELRCACTALGVKVPHILDYWDGHLDEVNPEELIAEILDVVQAVQPQVMLTFGPDGLSGHPDHVAIGQCAAEAFHRAGEVAALYTVGVPQSVAQRLGMGRVHPVPDEEIALVVNVTPAWEQKMAAIRCHATQLGASPMMQAPVEQQRRFFGTEHFAGRRPAARSGSPEHGSERWSVMNDVIHVTQLAKHYPAARGAAPVRAVDGIEFTVREGEVFGFLGPNGAGKTTTIRMLTGLTRPTAGGARVLGFDLATEVTRIKKRIGVVPEMSNLYDELSAFDNLVFSMQLYGVPRRERKARAEELLARFRLGEKRDTPFAKLSRGMKRALTVAAALAHRPPLLFLDEPTTGLDVMSARDLRQMIAGLRDEGVTVFLTTHYLEEAERLCDRIAIIVRGRIVALDTMDGLKARVQKRAAVEAVLADDSGGVETVRFERDDISVAVQAALAQAAADSRRVLSVNTLRPTLEDVFVHLTGLGVEVMLAEKGGKGGANAGG